MGHIENTLKMLFKLKPGVVIKKQELAQELEVSEKQISRYKRALDEMFCIDTIPGPLGGYKLLDTYFPFKELLNQEEVMLLKNYSSAIQYIDNDKLMKALDKINYSLLNNSQEVTAEIIPYSKVKATYNVTDIQNKIYEAILNKNEIILTYKGNSGEVTERRIQPFKLFIYKGEFYLIANCLKKSEIRYFKLTRITNMIVTGIKFESDFKVNDYLEKERENNLGIFGGNKYELKLIIYPPMANTISERVWVDNQITTELENGKIMFEATMKGGPEIISWILSMRSYVEVIEPTSLKEELNNEIEKMKNNFNK